MHAHGPKLTARVGYTLLELMIVLAILVTVTAVAWPSIARRIKLIGPREAALQVKADLAEARDAAMRTGEAWALRIERGTANYQFGPVSTFRDELLRPVLQGIGVTPGIAESHVWNSAEGRQPDAVDPPIADNSNSPAEQCSTPRSEIQSNVLPPGIVFDDGFAHRVSEANTARVSAQVNSIPSPNNIRPQNISAVEQRWRFAVVFQPDGRATESEIRLKEQSTEYTIRLRIRRFTGGVSIDKVQRKPKVVAPTVEDDFPPATDSAHQQFDAINAASPPTSQAISPSEFGPQNREQR